MIPRRTCVLIFLLPLLAGAGAGGHRLPSPPSRAVGPPSGGWDVKYLGQLQALGSYVESRWLEVQAVHAPEPPLDSRYGRVEDGAGVLVGDGRLLTTARYLVGATELRVLGACGTVVEAAAERVDEGANLAVVTFEPQRLNGALDVSDFAELPRPAADGGASQVMVPGRGGLGAVSVGIAAAMRVGGELFLSRVLANGVPAFDERGRVVALADRPTPDRSRTVAISAKDAKEWLDEKKGPPRTGRGGPDPEGEGGTPGSTS